MEEDVENSKLYEYYVVGGGLTLYPPLTKKLVFSDDELKEIALKGKMEKRPSNQFVINKCWNHGFTIYENLYGAAYQTSNNNHSLFDIWASCSYYCPILKIKTKMLLTPNSNTNANHSHDAPKILQSNELPPDFSIEEMYLQGYYHIGKENYHKEILDKAASQAVFTTGMIIGLFSLIGIIPILIYAAYRKYTIYQANKLLSQENYLFEKTGTAEWRLTRNSRPGELQPTLEIISSECKKNMANNDNLLPGENFHMEPVFIKISIEKPNLANVSESKLDVNSDKLSQLN